MAKQPPKPRLITLIHVAKAELQMDDDTYRDLLLHTTGKTSSKDCNIAQLNAVLERLKYAGFVVTAQTHHKPRAAMDKARLIGKIEALLADGAKPWSYAHAMAVQMFKIDRVHFCAPDQLWRIVAALEVDKKRKKGQITP